MYYTTTDNPVAQTRGTSSQIRAEFILIQTGFAAVDASFTAAAAITAAKGAIAGQVWTGTHDFTGATLRAATPLAASDVTTKAYVDTLAFTGALPSPSLGFIRYDGSNTAYSQTHTGYAQKEVKSGDIASAATLNLSTATGNLVHVTGTTGITAITVASGAEYTVVFDGALTITHNATTLILPSAANITTVAGDCMKVRGDGSGNARVVSYTRADGTPVKGGMTLLTPNGVAPTAANAVDFLTTFTSAYDNYLVVCSGLNVATSDSVAVRFAVSGVVDSGSNYYNSTIDAGGSTTSSATSFAATSTAITGGSGTSFTIEFRNMNDSSTRIKSMSSHGIVQNGTGPVGLIGFGLEGAYLVANTVSGFRLFLAGGANFAATGKIRVFGYNNS